MAVSNLGDSKWLAFFWSPSKPKDALNKEKMADPNVLVCARPQGNCCMDQLLQENLPILLEADPSLAERLE